MRTKNPATAKKIESFINTYYSANKKTPSLREIESSTGISRQTAQRYLKAMNEDGALQYAGRAGIITPFIDYASSVKTCRLPVCGQVICGTPDNAEEHIEDYLDFPASLLGSGDYFALHTYGDSMINAGITEGDLVIIRRQTTATVGQIVVALDDEGQSTLKRLAYDAAAKRYYLHPENDHLTDIYPAEIKIQGVAVKVLKDLQ